MNPHCFRTLPLRTAGAAVLAVGILAAGSPAAALAWPGEYTTKVIFKNHTDTKLTLSHSQVTDGRWTQSPPHTIAAKGVGRFGTASTDEPGGTGGTVTYKSAHGDVVVYWYDPDTPDPNEYTCHAPFPFNCTAIGAPGGQHPKLNVDLH